MRLVAISGSLRAHSSNGELLRALARLGRPEIVIDIYDGLATLPHFNPDLDQDGMDLPAPVQELRRMLAESSGLLISSPEYAHGVPGSLKNALDWLVSGPEMVYKPIGLLNPSPRSVHAHAALAETLRTMSARLVDGACIELPISGRGIGADEILANEELRAKLENALDSMRAATSSGSLLMENE
jgi:chromate reductase